MIFDRGRHEPGVGSAITGRDRLGDARLNKRSVTLLDRLADKPTASIPHACNGWAKTQAAYRFLAQEEIGWEDILAPHFGCTQQRMRDRPVVLCIRKRSISPTSVLPLASDELSRIATTLYNDRRCPGMSGQQSRRKCWRN
jgi:hypothetical protein